MKLAFPQFHFHKHPIQEKKKDEVVFAEARDLAQLRLEQCMADLQSTSVLEGKPLSISQGQGGVGKTREKPRRQPSAASVR